MEGSSSTTSKSLEPSKKLARRWAATSRIARWRGVRPDQPEVCYGVLRDDALLVSIEAQVSLGEDALFTCSSTWRSAGLWIVVLADPTEPAGQEHGIYFVDGTASKFRTGKPIAHLGRVSFRTSLPVRASSERSLAAIAGRRASRRISLSHGRHRCTKLMNRASESSRGARWLSCSAANTPTTPFSDLNLLETGAARAKPSSPATIWSRWRTGDEPVVTPMLRTPRPDHAEAPRKERVSRFGFSPKSWRDSTHPRRPLRCCIVETGILPSADRAHRLHVARHAPLDHGATPRTDWARAGEAGRLRATRRRPERALAASSLDSHADARLRARPEQQGISSRFSSPNTTTAPAFRPHFVAAPARRY